MKILISALLAVMSISVGAIFNVQPAYAATPPDSCFDFDSGTGTVARYYNNENDDELQPACTKSVDIPSTIGGVPVTTIGDYAFLSNQLTTVTIPNSVTTIGDGAFGDNQLTTLTIGDSVTTIGDYAFYDNQLTSVTIPDSVTTIGDYAFYYNQLTSVTIPDSVTAIGDSAFSYNQLTSVTIPNSVTAIGNEAFADNQLTTVTFMGQVVSFGSDVLRGNPITTISYNGATYDQSNPLNEACFTFSSGTITDYLKLDMNLIKDSGIACLKSDVTIPSSIGGVPVTTIGDYAFLSNQLTSVTIPNSVTTIGDYAFLSNQLTSVTIPNSVTTIGDSAFALQSSLGRDLNDELYTGNFAQRQAGLNEIWYARVYTSDSANPNGLQDDALTESFNEPIGDCDVDNPCPEDFNGDGDTDDVYTESFGGHLINPAQATVTYKNTISEILAPAATMTGVGLNSYRSAQNTTHDLARYFRLGATQPFVAPSIAGYTTVTPTSPHVTTLAAANTPIDFVYSGAPTVLGIPLVGAPNSGVGGALPFRIMLAFLAGGLLLASFVAVAVAVRRKTKNIVQFN